MKHIEIQLLLKYFERFNCLFEISPRLLFFDKRPNLNGLSIYFLLIIKIINE